MRGRRMSIWAILAYLAIGYALVFGASFAGQRLYEHQERRRRIRRRLGIAQ